MGSPAQRKVGVLKSPGTNIVPLPTTTDVWPECLMVKDSFWVMADEIRLGAVVLFKSFDEDHRNIYQTLFKDHSEEEGIIMDLNQFLGGSRLRNCHGEIYVLNPRLCIINPTMPRWWRLWQFKKFPIKILKARVKKALDCSRLLSATKHHQDLEFLISRCTVESHTLIALWRAFEPRWGCGETHHAALVCREVCDGLWGRWSKVAVSYLCHDGP